MLGDETGATAALADAERASVLPRYFDSRLYLARAAVHALAGRHDQAVASADEGADWSARAGMAVDEALALDLRIRLEPTRAAADRLRGLTERTDSGLVAELADHARALIRHDPAGLLSVAGDLASRSAWLMAAEAAAAAAEIHRSHHQDRAAQGAARQALEWAGHCEGARSTLLDQLVAPTALTRRELEVARLAALGHSSKMIAERLHVSIRTVETHLYRSYAKLGITDRTELGAALAAQDPESR
jgi:DNA-binding NarL/FixJ family response regulator